MAIQAREEKQLTCLQELLLGNNKLVSWKAEEQCLEVQLEHKLDYCSTIIAGKEADSRGSTRRQE